MTERISIDGVRSRAANLNRRLEATGRHVEVEQRNGHVALDEYQGTSAIRTITVGTKHEVADFLHAAMVGIDLSNVLPEAVVEQARHDAEAVLGGPAKPLDPSDLIKALCVIVLDPAIRAHLDPKALSQARSALGLEA